MHIFLQNTINNICNVKFLIMSKSYFSYLLLGLCCVAATAEAAVTPLPGCVTPQSSTADNPKWYVMMSSHLTDADRMNRFMQWDGENITTVQFNNGMSADDITPNFMWRLESTGSNNSYVYLVNAANEMRIAVPSEATAEDGSSNVNTPLQMNSKGSVWELCLSSEMGLSSDCADNQYCLRFINYMGDGFGFLNAMVGGASVPYGVTIYTSGIHQASGWFFYPAVSDSTATEETKTVSVATSDKSKGAVAISGYAETTVKVGKEESVTVKAVPNAGYMFYKWVNDSTKKAVSYRSSYTYEGTESISLVAEFVEEGYPIMTRFYEVDLNQQNRYLGEATYTADGNTETIFTCESESDLPFVEYRKLHVAQEEGAVVDKTATPIQIEEGATSFSMHFKQYDKNISYNNGEEDLVCEPELVWTRQTLYIDWNNNMQFDEGEVYGSVGDASGDSNNFGDPSGSAANGWSRTITVPDGVAPGTYRMRVLYSQWYEDGYEYKVFNEYANEIRNGIAYDFTIQVNARQVVNYTVDFSVSGDKDLVDAYLYDAYLCDTDNNDLGNPATIEEGTSYRLCIVPKDGEMNMAVLLEKNGESVSLVAGDGMYYYDAVADGDASYVIKVTDLSGIEDMQQTAAYYNSASQSLVLGDACKVVIYDVTGCVVLVSENASEVSVADLGAGIYVANVNGQVLKFRK